MTTSVATLARLRLAAQGILPTSTSPTPGPVDVVRSMTALQGQDFPGALWSIGLRSPGSSRTGIEAAFNRGELVRSCPLRGTLHVTVAEDLGWILSLTAERMAKGQATRHRQLEITTPDVDQVRVIALSLLEGSGGRVTRDELTAAFEQAGQSTKAQRGYHFLFLLCLEGTLVQGPINSEGNGNSQFYVSAREWIKNPRTLDRGGALAELALRYFRSHGPATVSDFQWWSKLTLADIRTGLDGAAGELETIECNGATYYLAPETAELTGGTVPGARSVLLLPGFDEYLLGYTDRSAALAPEHAPLTVPGNNGMFKATVVTGGKVAGTWRKAQTAAERERQRAGAVLPELFDGLTPNQDKALDKTAKAYARWLSN
ncbi:Winged helix DNA-binding domain-containing protein [Arthrobacter alpinus]|uniref:Winged helix DNA-binding domain-containing protein n=1 Tax=Arthrobacter alpinus TaxID=656366 RepID=A0A1H5NIF6_9MICC|nr:winged helix DNA-binding domain-containing protein [Arthrobacter alpinus]SEF00651.1 Winged helix DNA-binding domain-containing protein [Arthrobacter alpinus]